jgi:parallel beta-helix repeat protein
VNASDQKDHVFYVAADYVNISGFTVTGATGDGRAGIWLNTVDHCTISENTASNSTYGICLYSASTNTLTGNTASNNSFRGIWLYYSSNNNTLAANTVLNNGNGIYLTHSSTNTLTGNTALNNGDGIFLYSASTNTLTDNTANSNTEGILLDSSNTNTLTGNTANSNTNVGILLSSSSTNTLTDNTASNNTDGIFLSSSSTNTLTDNTALNNTRGIYLYNSSTNTLTGNTASNNGDRGMYLYSSSNSNTLTGNTASNNYYGICLYSSSNNTIYNNYFNNTNNAWDDGTNIWNISKIAGTNIIGGPYLGGNYWNDYTGNDADSDGLGDTAYDISGGTNKDYLPLVHISDTLGSISGKVTFTCNTTGIAGATVNLIQGGSVIDSTVTDSNGSYTFANVPLGAYSVNTSKVHFWDNSTDVTVTAGAPTEVNMMLWLKGDLYNDGVLDIYDIIMLRQAAAENIPWDYRYDLYVDDMVDIYDIIVLRQAVAGNVVLE